MLEPKDSCYVSPARFKIRFRKVGLLSANSPEVKGVRTLFRFSYMPDLDPIRCPYCVEGNHFKVMTEVENGMPLKCGHCGHLVALNNPFFKCTCVKCFALDHPDRGIVRQRLSTALAGHRSR